MNKFSNECPYGVGKYVDRLLDEKIELNKASVVEHINNGDVHVTLEDKEKWNSVSEAVLNSSIEDDDGNPVIEIPENVSYFNNDANYVSSQDLSYYATEEEVRSWLNGYITREEYEADDGSGSYSGDNGEYVDGDIIDKFQLDTTKQNVAGTKSFYLAFEAGKLKLKRFTGQSASLSQPEGVEYKQSASRTFTATYTDADMTSVVLKEGANTIKTFAQNDHTCTVTFNAGDFTANKTYTLYYTPTEDTAGTDSKTIPVLKRWYMWYGGASASNTLTLSSGTLSSGKPSSISVSAPTGQYVYLAFPTSWNVNTGNFKVGGFEFGHTTLSNINGPYGETGDYKVIRSSQTGINGTINT